MQGTMTPLGRKISIQKNYLMDCSLAVTSYKADGVDATIPVYIIHSNKMSGLPVVYISEAEVLVESNDMPRDYWQAMAALCYSFHQPAVPNSGFQAMTQALQLLDPGVSHADFITYCQTVFNQAVQEDPGNQVLNDVLRAVHWLQSQQKPKTAPS